MAGNMANKPNTKMYRSNDGTSIPGWVKEPIDKGHLNADTPLDNSMAFEDSPTGNNAVIRGMDSWLPSENLDDPGFDANGNCFYKHGTPYGEKALFNQLPPGPDISDQAYILINEMKLKTIVDLGYPGDGAFPARDVPE